MTADQRQVQAQLAYAEMQLFIADRPADKAYWGIRVDQLEAALEDLNELPLSQ